MPTPDNQPAPPRKPLLTRPRVLTLLTILLFLASLPFSALLVQTPNGDRWVSSLIPLMMGWLGVFELCFAWFANPLLLIAWMNLHKPDYRALAILCAITAFLLALSVLIIRPTLYGDNEADPILSYGPGYYLWLASILTTLLASLLPAKLPTLQPRPS